jgi:hypothetical protein
MVIGIPEMVDNENLLWRWRQVLIRMGLYVCKWRE